MLHVILAMAMVCSHDTMKANDTANASGVVTDDRTNVCIDMDVTNIALDLNHVGNAHTNQHGTITIDEDNGDTTNIAIYGSMLVIRTV